MRALATSLLLIQSIVAASAAGGFSCEVDDEKVTLAFAAGTTHGMGSAMFSFMGKLEIKSPEVANDLRSIEFERGHVPQYWLDSETLKVLLYRERDTGSDHGFVEVSVETTTSEDGDDRGTYRVSVFDMTGVIDGEAKQASFSGEVTCSVE